MKARNKNKKGLFHNVGKLNKGINELINSQTICWKLQKQIYALFNFRKYLIINCVLWEKLEIITNFFNLNFTRIYGI